MCGIAGIAALDDRPLDPEAIKRMCDVQAHRGPDDAGYVYFRVGEQTRGEGGYWTGFNDPEFSKLTEHLPVFGGQYWREELSNGPYSLALGHRRLSIIDLSHYGHQPMNNSDRRFWITFNGEIYNYLELRGELEGRGHVFRSRTDTEVLLHLWEEMGAACLPLLNGMFAFAMYDRIGNELTLARDRFGVKPLYYAAGGGRFAFASEVKAILASGVVEPALNPSSLREYFTFQNTLGRATLFEGVSILPPGELLRIKPQRGDEPVARRYHQGFAPADPGLAAGPRLETAVLEAFEGAVNRQLISDVEVGSYLSGGMDSGSIVAVTCRSIPRLLTFTCGFDLTNVNGIEQSFDERTLADKLAHLLQTEHYHVVLHSGDMPAAMERLTWHMDDPRVGMCYPKWYVSKLASRFVKVCLSGAGGDEMFAGYPWRYRPCFTAASTEEFDRDYLRYWHRLLPPEEIGEIFNPGVDWGTRSAERAYQEVMAGAPAPHQGLEHAENLLQRALYFETKTFLHGFLLTDDHMSMAHGLETRVPFLDNDLADLAFRIPPRCKVDLATLAAMGTASHVESAEGKIILRRAMERLLPREFTRRIKQGFSPPDANWYMGPSMDYIKSILLDGKTLSRPWFNQSFVASKLDEHFTGRLNHRLLIWSLLSVEWLQRHFVDQVWTAKG